MANIIKGLLPTGKAPAALKTEIIELIQAEAPAPDLSGYATTEALDAATAPLATKEELAQSGAVQRLTLTAPTTSISTGGWDTSRAYALVITQDSAGSRKATYAGEEITLDTAPLAATITAWVHDGTAWVWRSSAGTATPAAPPAWAEGTTVSTGTIEATSVVFTFSQPIAAGAAVQYRAGSSDSWRPAVIETPTSVRVSGLTPESSYPAFDFRLINGAGPSGTITAEPFSTPTKPPGWEQIRLATFTSATEIPYAEYVPELGSLPTLTGGKAATYVTGGHAEVRYTTQNYATQAVTWASLPTTGKKLRLSATYSGLDTAATLLKITTNVSQLHFTMQYGAKTLSASPSLGGGSVVELTGSSTLPPASGVATLTGEDDIFTFAVDGVTYRRWQVTWGSNYGPLPASYARAEFGLGGGDLTAVRPVSAVKISEISVEAWQ